MQNKIEISEELKLKILNSEKAYKIEKELKVKEKEEKVEVLLDPWIYDEEKEKHEVVEL
jgi:hypothetical protein